MFTLSYNILCNGSYTWFMLMYMLVLMLLCSQNEFLWHKWGFSMYGVGSVVRIIQCHISRIFFSYASLLLISDFFSLELPGEKTHSSDTWFWLYKIFFKYFWYHPFPVSPFSDKVTFLYSSNSINIQISQHFFCLWYNKPTNQTSCCSLNFTHT